MTATIWLEHDVIRTDSSNRNYTMSIHPITIIILSVHIGVALLVIWLKCPKPLNKISSLRWETTISSAQQVSPTSHHCSNIIAADWMPVFYWGTPVVLITTTNEDGSANIGPMSSVFWLGNRCMLGLEHISQTTINLRRTGQCVLNLPSDNMVGAVNALARTTGTEVVPDVKIALGYRYEKDKFGAAGLTPQQSNLVLPPRIKECPAQMEAELTGVYEMMSSLPGEAKGFTLAIEVRILRTYVLDELRLPGYTNRIDPDAWKPMIMSFQHLYGLKPGKLEKSTLANIEEELYRLPAEEPLQ